MKRFWTFLMILTSLIALGTPLAEAQPGGTDMRPRSPRVLESDGEVVLTLTISAPRPTRVKYRTFDVEAKTPGDYTAVSGEALIFGNTVTIRIPIVDDDGAESEETFIVRSWEAPPEEVSPEPPKNWPWGTAIVRLIDDDSDVGTGSPDAVSSTTSEDAPAPAAVSTTLMPRGAHFSSSAIDARAPIAVDAATTSTITTAVPPTPGEVALPLDELRPGPGFEDTGEEAREAVTERGGVGGDSASGLVIGSGLAAIGVGALAAVRRRQRRSTSQSDRLDPDL